MPVTPAEILESAAESSEGDREVNWRNAGSRAYFAAFHHCRGIAVELEPHVDVSRSDAHQVVPDVLRARGGTPRRIAYMLIQCRGIRNNAGYDVQDTFLRERALTAVEVSGSVLNLGLEHS